MTDPSTIAENRDAISHLALAGFGPLLTALEDPRCYTRGGKLIVAEVARRLCISQRQASVMLSRARAVLQ